MIDDKPLTLADVLAFIQDETNMDPKDITFPSNFGGPAFDFNIDDNVLYTW